MATTYSPGLMRVPSAMGDLTSLFGMGRGEHPRQNHHKTLQVASFWIQFTSYYTDVYRLSIINFNKVTYREVILLLKTFLLCTPLEGMGAKIKK